MNFGLKIYDYKKSNSIKPFEMLKIQKNLQKQESNFTSNEIKNIVLIIGESVNRNHCELYGGIYKNNPVVKNLNQVVFTDTISPQNGTNVTMKEILFFHKNQNFYENLNLVSLYNLAGYDTFWISNQDTANLGNIAFSVGKTTQNNYFYSMKEIYLYFPFDEILLPKIENFYKKSQNKNFFVIHLMGSHVNYAKRYPKNFEIFKTSDIKDKNLDEKQKQVKAHYLNSLLYTDFVIGEIYKIFKDDESLIIYLSDHGESVYDYKNFVGHGVDLKQIAEIPFIFIATQKFLQNHAQIWDKLKNVKDLPFTTKNLPHLLSEISQIKSNWFDPKLSIINQSYNKNAKRYLNDKLYENLE